MLQERERSRYEAVCVAALCLVAIVTSIVSLAARGQSGLVVGWSVCLLVMALGCLVVLSRKVRC